MTAQLSNDEATRIGDELERAVRDHSHRHPSHRHPYHHRAAEKAARVCGRPQAVVSGEFAPVEPRVEPRIEPLVVEHITTQVMTTWVRTPPRARDAQQQRQRLIRPLVGVAHAHGRCEGKPLGLWMLEKARSHEVSERKAIADAVRLMLAAPPMQGELATVLCAQLADQNRLVRAAAACIVARAGARLPRTYIEGALLSCLRECIDSALHPARPPLRPARTIDELDVYAEDLRGNHLDAYAWTAAAAAFDGIRLPVPAIAELRKGLGAPHWLVRAVAATVLTRAGHAQAIAEAAAARIRSADPAVRQEALRQLFALAEVSQLSEAALRAVREAIRAGDLCTRAAALWPLAVASRAAGGGTPALREIANGPAWPLHTVAEEALLLSRPFGHGDIIQLFQRYVTGTVETGRRLSLFEQADTSTQPDRPLTACLGILYDWHDRSPLGQEMLLERMHSVEQAVRQTEALRTEPGRIDILRDRASLSILFFGEIRTALTAMEQIGRSLFPIHPVRMALHAGKGVALKPQPGGDWAIEGDLVTAAAEIATAASAREALVSDRVAEVFYADRELTRRLRGRGTVTVTGAVEMHFYLLEDPVRAMAASGFAVLPRQARWTEILVKLVRATVGGALVGALLFGLIYAGARWGPDIKRQMDGGMARSVRKPVVLGAGAGAVEAGTPAAKPTLVTGPDIKIVEDRKAGGGQVATPPRPGGGRATVSTAPTISVSHKGKSLVPHSVMPKPAKDGGDDQHDKVGVDIALGTEGFAVTGIEVWDEDNSKFSIDPAETRHSDEVAGKWVCVEIRYKDPVSGKVFPPVVRGFSLPPP